jgi:thermopsin
MQSLRIGAGVAPVAFILVLSAVSALATAAPPSVPTPARSVDLSASLSSSALPSTPAASTTACDPPSGEGSHLLTSANDPAWAQFTQHTKHVAANALSAGLPASDLHLPYLGSFPNQEVNGVPESGVQLSSECSHTLSTGGTPAPAGVNYQGETETGASPVPDMLQTNSLLGILNVNSSRSFYPDSATPTQWGAQLNSVLVDVTIKGAPVYDFWTQNVISYDSHNDAISFVDDTWNFTTPLSEMEPSSLVSWSPNGSDYTGVWVAYSQYYYAPAPFTAYVYVNSSVNGAGDQVLWYNYSLWTGAHHYHGTYDDLVFNATTPVVAPAQFLASPVPGPEVEVDESYEFDAFIGADDGSNQLVLGANATEQLKYCSLISSPTGTGCTPMDHTYANVPAAVNYGTQTGEETVGVAVNYVGATAYLSAGPLIEHGLWNYTGETGVGPGNTKVVNDITVSGSPRSITQQPYIFVFFNDTAYSSGDYAWAAEVPDWYLMPGTYDYALMLSDYQERTGAITVGSSTTTLTATLPYSSASGVYTPLWALDNAQVAGISSSGTGAISDQYVLFNNPTSSCTFCDGASNGQLSSVFYTKNDYSFKSFSGVFLNGTSVYIDVNAPPSFAVASGADLNFQFFETSNVTLSNAAAIGGWPSQEEISFYTTVPASQNPAPQGDVYVWNSTHDLIMSNHFVAVEPGSGYVSPDQLVLYGGTDNVVWGNTFSDPAGVALGSSYAGIGLAESGDLIYNNNFSIDNPVVYLPYNFANVADCLPQHLGGCSHYLPAESPWYYNNPVDTWNVAPQPASNVVNTINGFSLKGNVLGPTYPLQGGNFWWNYGSSPNNRTTLPYVDRFAYTEWSDVYPLGCGTIEAPGAPCGTAPAVVGSYENGIQNGGDCAVLLLNRSLAACTFDVKFTESGLVSGTRWSVTVNTTTLSSTGTTITFVLEDGTYSYSVGAVMDHTVSPASGSLTVNGAPLKVPVKFTPITKATYPVTFAETGLPSGHEWNVTLMKIGKMATTGTSIVFPTVPNGTYSYRIAVGYPQDSYKTTFSGTVTMDGASSTVNVVFTQAQYQVTFEETGLSHGTHWMVVAGTGHKTVSGSGTILTMNLPNGTFSWTASASGYDSPRGTVTVNGGVATVMVTFRSAVPRPV